MSFNFPLLHSKVIDDYFSITNSINQPVAPAIVSSEIKEEGKEIVKKEEEVPPFYLWIDMQDGDEITSYKLEPSEFNKDQDCLIDREVLQNSLDSSNDCPSRAKTRDQYIQRLKNFTINQQLKPSVLTNLINSFFLIYEKPFVPIDLSSNRRVTVCHQANRDIRSTPEVVLNGKTIWHKSQNGTCTIDDKAKRIVNEIFEEFDNVGMLKNALLLMTQAALGRSTKEAIRSFMTPSMFCKSMDELQTIKLKTKDSFGNPLEMIEIYCETRFEILDMDNDMNKIDEIIVARKVIISRDSLEKGSCDERTIVTDTVHSAKLLAPLGSKSFGKNS